jgi:hypothetical protein
VDGEAHLTVVGSELEAEVVCQLLRTAGIACFHRATDFAAEARDGLLAGAGPREVLVRPDDLERAQEVIRTDA